MQSSTVLAFRALVMLTCLVLVPLAALFGTPLAGMLASAIGSRGGDSAAPHAALSSAESAPPPLFQSTTGLTAAPATTANAATPTPPPSAQAPAPAAPAASVAVATPAAPAAANAWPAGAPTAIGTALADMPASLDATLSNASPTPTVDPAAALAAHASTSLLNSASPIGANLPPSDAGVRTASTAPPAMPSYPNTGYAAPPPGAFVSPIATGAPPVASQPAAPPTTPPAVGGNAAAAPPTSDAVRNARDRFTQIQEELRARGATYYLLETWGSDGSLYRFHCKMAVDGEAGYTRQFEATDGDPLRAMEWVLSEIAAWQRGG